VFSIRPHQQRTATAGADNFAARAEFYAEFYIVRSLQSGGLRRRGVRHDGAGRPPERLAAG
jgi:hypothetical protein